MSFVVPNNTSQLAAVRGWACESRSILTACDIVENFLPKGLFAWTAIGARAHGRWSAIAVEL